MYRKLTENYRTFANGPCYLWDRLEMHHNVDSHFNFSLTWDCVLLIFVQGSILADFSTVSSRQLLHSPTAGWRLSGKQPRLREERGCGVPDFLPWVGSWGNLLSKACGALVSLFLHRDWCLCAKTHHGRSVWYLMLVHMRSTFASTFRYYNMDFWPCLRAEECSKDFFPLVQALFSPWLFLIIASGLWW